ncbi:MAG: acetylxylan esterase [Phycisphaeraceae bacterium]
MRVLDYVQTLREADSEHIGVMGISGGGMHTFFSAALDTRIKAAVISGYFCDWSRSILAANHCTCNFVPGLLQFGELGDLAGLIAPRPCLIENATRDDIFPIDAVKRTVTRARKAWRAFGSPDLLQTDYFEGRHEIHGSRAYDFLAQHLSTRRSTSAPSDPSRESHPP